RRAGHGFTSARVGNDLGRLHRGPHFVTFTERELGGGRGRDLGDQAERGSELDADAVTEQVEVTDGGRPSVARAALWLAAVERHRGGGDDGEPRSGVGLGGDDGDA